MSFHIYFYTFYSLSFLLLLPCKCMSPQLCKDIISLPMSCQHLNPLLVWLTSLLRSLRWDCGSLHRFKGWIFLALFRVLFPFMISLSLLLPCWSISAIALVGSVHLVSLNHLCQQMLRIMTGCTCYNISTALTCRVISLASVYNSNSVKCLCCCKKGKCWDVEIICAHWCLLKWMGVRIYNWNTDAKGNLKVCFIRSPSGGKGNSNSLLCVFGNE